MKELELNTEFILLKSYSSRLDRTSTFALTIIVGALFFERAFDQGADAIYEHINERKLCKHIKHKYENKE
ncbi:hypothetical protein JEQ12_000423 [Ovis aries]|uniref:Complex III subunit 9 n=1 Tax=Ovis aries TaxID=9940 RepID=A0A836AFP6_SHEEP|nr:hypothetical protein JEQ12_000423 [Ovis aries]